MRSSSAWIAFSARESRAEVASSKIRMRGFFSSARDGDALLFDARELEAALADCGFVLRRQALDEIVDVRGARCLEHLGVARLGPAVADVVEDGVVEEHRILRNDADGAA